MTEIPTSEPGGPLKWVSQVFSCKRSSFHLERVVFNGSIMSSRREAEEGMPGHGSGGRLKMVTPRRTTSRRASNSDLPVAKDVDPPSRASLALLVGYRGAPNSHMDTTTSLVP